MEEVAGWHTHIATHSLQNGKCSAAKLRRRAYRQAAGQAEWNERRRTGAAIKHAILTEESKANTQKKGEAAGGVGGR